MNVDNGFQQTAGDSTNNEPRVGGKNVNELVAVVRLALNAVDTAGGVFSWENDTSDDFIVDLSYVDVTTAATGACTIDVGVAANATTLDDTIIDGVDVGTAAIIANNIDNKGSNGGIGIKVESGEFITASVASGASAGIVGNAYIKLYRV